MDELIKMLKRHEGVETHAYKCTANKTTVGVGRNIQKDSGLGLSGEEIDFLLSNDIIRCMKELKSEYTWFSDLDEVRSAAIVDCFFCLGATRFRGFKRMILCLEKADYSGASIEILDSKFAKQTKGRALELSEMIKTGLYAG
tara:strand:+ start:828 stop:1253 length:426 start_codon:yes stop_codon:yes gene_type:complete